MPAYRVYTKESPEAETGEFATWELPWLRLVFDQRFDHTPEGAEEPGRYQVLDCRKDEKGDYFVVCPVPPKRRGAI